ncbi:MAG: hypothetical protein CK548_03855 [Opitutia bacterium]|nr:MAG: hypothetical protein CK548_03855 [Opitutae bacterium]
MPRTKDIQDPLLIATDKKKYIAAFNQGNNRGVIRFRWMFFAQSDVDDFSLRRPFRKSVTLGCKTFQFIDARRCDDADRTIGVAQNALVNFAGFIIHRSAGGDKCPAIC